MRPIVLSVAASDPTGGAGIQADLKAIEASGGQALTVVTAVTSQNASGVQSIRLLEVATVRAQLQDLLLDASPAAVKTGALGSAEIVTALVRTLSGRSSAPCVVDPVALSKNGLRLNDAATLDTMVERLFPLATLITPNVDDVRLLTGLEVRDARQAERAGHRLLESGCRAVLVKGGHHGVGEAVDVLVTRDAVRHFAAERIETQNTHGTGCVYASAIATGLARGEQLEQAVAGAKEFVTASIRHGFALGRGAGSVDPLHPLPGRAGAQRPAASTGGSGPGRLHVVTDEQLQSRFSHVELARLAARGGADVIQLRDKRAINGRALTATAREMRVAIRGTPARLVVNDHVDTALAAGAHGVHLGARDATPWRARTMLGSGALIGATVNDLERATGLCDEPVDYLGVGPVFGTRSKAGPAPALGLEGLRRIVAAVPFPVIAIGNVTPQRVGDLLAAGAHGVAVLSSIVGADDPAARTAEFAAAIRQALAGRVA